MNRPLAYPIALAPKLGESEHLPSLDDPLGHGIRLFNEGYFFEAHEHLEGIWIRDTTPSRKFYQGLIQVASGYHHFQNGNPRGAVRLLVKGSNLLRPFGPAHGGVDITSLLRAVQEHAGAISTLQDGAASNLEVEFPKIRYDPPP